MNYKKTNKVVIEIIKGNHHKITCMQNLSNPSAYFLKKFEKGFYKVNIEYYIPPNNIGSVLTFISGEKFSEYLVPPKAMNKKMGRLSYQFHNKSSIIAKVGFLFKSNHKGDYIRVRKISILKKEPVLPIKVNPFFNNMKIYQVAVSPSLFHFKKRIQRIYNLRPYYNVSLPALFFGAYRPGDIQMLKKHKSKIYILWGGTDADDRFERRRKFMEEIKTLNVEKHFSTSPNLHERLTRNGFPNQKILLSLVDTNLFKPAKKLGDKIFIYNGFKLGNNEALYGKEIFEEVVKRLPKFKYIYSNQLNLPYEKMPQVYAQCFIGMRLTTNDGNANSVQEMGAMNIDVIHNGEYDNCIHWSSADDIVEIITKKAKMIKNNNNREMTKKNTDN